MARTFGVGIDVGSYQVKVAISEPLSPRERALPRILGTGFAESKGLRHGYIVNTADVTRSVRLALRQAEKSANLKVRRAHISVGGIGLQGTISQGSVIISRADSEITELDVEKVLEVCESDIPKTAMQNRRVLHTVPLQYKLDSKVVLGRPHGMKGTKLEVRSLFITSLEQHQDDLLQAVEAAGVEVEDVVAAPIAASLVTLTKLQKMAGCVLANIGAETVSIVVFENAVPVSLEIFPLGSSDITNDIALGLRIPIEEAEEVKHKNANDVPYPRKKLEEIVSARLTDIFELIEAHLKKIGRSGLLPAGIVLTGGGSSIMDIEEFAKYALKLPSKIGTFTSNSTVKSAIKDATWAVAYGLSILASQSIENEETGFKLVKSTQRTLRSWIKQFLP